MEIASHSAIPVVDRSQVAAARQAAQAVALGSGFSETDAHRVGIVATELASNLVKHSEQGGQLLIRGGTGADAEVEMFALDRGPGMQDALRSLVDGYSTAGSQGAGLGAVKRLADEFDIYSQPGKGTAVLARLRPRGAVPGRPPVFEVAGVSVAMPGEHVCGDAWGIVTDRGRAVIGVMDGLGHGTHAAAAATAGIAAVLSRTGGTSAEILTAIHEALRHTRGAAGTVVSIEPRDSVITVAGVGNVAAAVVADGHIRQAVSLGGILGHGVRTFRQYQYPWPEGALLVMHSDGLTSHWSLDSYPGLRLRHPALVAAVLYRDYQRGRDDVTVVVGKAAA